MEKIVISKNEFRDVLERYLEHPPTEREVTDFMEYCRTDVPEWLRDNAKCWVREIRDELRCEECRVPLTDRELENSQKIFGEERKLSGLCLYRYFKVI